MPGSSTYYWDSCLFLAWLKNETTRKPGEMDGVRDFINRCRRRELIITTSTLTFAEVSEAKLPSGVYDLFEDLMKRPGIEKYSVDMRVAKLAGKIKDHYVVNRANHGGKTLTTPDAIHLATAILLKVNEFHTFDERGTEKYLGLIPLSGNVAGHDLVVTKPIAIQQGIPNI